MNEEEITRYDEKILFEELSKDKLRRSNILINLNVSLQNIQRITANIKDFRELQEYKIAVVSVENELKELQQENQQLKEEFDRMFAIYHSRKLIKKFNDEYDEEDKMKNPNRDYACVCPDAEEVYKRYYELKEQLQQKEDIINKAKEYIENNPLYDIDVYEYSICLNGIDDEQTRKELLEILDNKGE